MASGLSNKLVGQAGEYLACAELARRGLIATTFSGNVPEYDLLVCDHSLRTLPVQVKTTSGDSWRSRADLWLNIEIDDSQKKQISGGPKAIVNPDLVYICVALGKNRKEDRFFICSKRDLQNVCIITYTRWMDSIGWIRPRNYKSLDNRYAIVDLVQFEDNWGYIEDRLRGS